jgi:hypothetical protein
MEKMRSRNALTRIIHEGLLELQGGLARALMALAGECWMTGTTAGKDLLNPSSPSLPLAPGS